MSRKNILVIGDIHEEPWQSFERIHLLGHFIEVKQPDIILQVGDWGSWASLSHWDRGTIHIEGKRYAKDVDRINQSLGLLDVSIKQAEASRGKLIQREMLEGNHEQWIHKAVEHNPTLEGTISLDDVAFNYYGWKVTPFLKPRTIQGFSCKHYFTSGLMGRPIGGESPAVTMLRKTHESCISGHSHEFHAHETVNGSGHKMLSLVAGCFINPRDMGRIHFTRETPRWWSGLIMIYDAQGGYGSYAKYDYDYLRRRYA